MASGDSGPSPWLVVGPRRSVPSSAGQSGHGVVSQGLHHVFGAPDRWRPTPSRSARGSSRPPTATMSRQSRPPTTKDACAPAPGVSLARVLRVGRSLGGDGYHRLGHSQQLSLAGHARQCVGHPVEHVVALPPDALHLVGCAHDGEDLARCTSPDGPGLATGASSQVVAVTFMYSSWSFTWPCLACYCGSG